MENITKKTFNELVAKIKIKENFVPRDYKTIGGMWTVETWQKDDLKVQLMDEGYTLVLLKMNDENKVDWKIMRNGKDELFFENISEKEFQEKYSEEKRPIVKNKI
jgi:hypothetical protein